MERSLAHIEQITNIRPIDGCDNIEQCNVLGWNLIIKKGEFQADGKSKIYDTLREGLVIRDSANTVSFKCISNKFLIKHDL